MIEYRLTTIDNPYDPFDQFNEWFLYDVTHGYNTCGLLDRISNTSPNDTDDINDERIKLAMDEIIANDFTGLYKRVYRESVKENVKPAVKDSNRKE